MASYTSFHLLETLSVKGLPKELVFGLHLTPYQYAAKLHKSILFLLLGILVHYWFMLCQQIIIFIGKLYGSMIIGKLDMIFFFIKKKIAERTI